MSTTIKKDGTRERSTYGESEAGLYKPIKLKRRSPEDQFVENIVSSTRLMTKREGIQRKLLDALARDLLKEGVPLNKLIATWSRYTTTDETKWAKEGHEEQASII